MLERAKEIYDYYQSKKISNKHFGNCNVGLNATATHFDVTIKTVQNAISACKKDLGIKRGSPIKDVNILLLDIETSLMEFRGFNVWKTNIRPEQVKKDWFMLSWAAKWLNESDYFGDVVTSEEAIKQDDKRICKSLWDTMCDADIIIAHNAKKFDIKRINTRLLINGFVRPTPYQVIDTLIVFKKLFGFTFNRLDFINYRLGVQRKIENDGYDLWDKCFDGDSEALQTMFTYNKGDIGALEDLYMTIRGWITSHPNLNLYAEGEEMRCHICLSENITPEDEYMTAASTFRTVRCNDCGGLSRVRTSGLTIEKRRNLLMGLAR